MGQRRCRHPAFTTRRCPRNRCPGVKLVEYHIDDGSGEGEGLFRTFDGVEREEQEGTTLFITEKPLVLLAGGDELFPAAELRQDSEEGVWEREIPIRSFNVEYYDGLAEEWTPEWNSDELGFLPWAVRIQINLAKTKSQLRPMRRGVDPHGISVWMVAIMCGLGSPGRVSRPEPLPEHRSGGGSGGWRVKGEG